MHRFLASWLLNNSNIDIHSTFLIQLTTSPVALISNTGTTSSSYTPPNAVHHNLHIAPWTLCVITFALQSGTKVQRFWKSCSQKPNWTQSVRSCWLPLYTVLTVPCSVTFIVSGAGSPGNKCFQRREQKTEIHRDSQHKVQKSTAASGRKETSCQ